MEESAQPVCNAPASRSRKDQINFPSDHGVKMIGPSLAGGVLARRYKILGTIGADSFKAHDLALDQTVTVRQAVLTGKRDGDTWRRKVQQLAFDPQSRDLPAKPRKWPLDFCTFPAKVNTSVNG